MPLKIIRIFEENIKELTRVDEHRYRVVIGDGERFMSDTQLVYFLSGGTTKGILLYTLKVASLKEGFDLMGRQDNIWICHANSHIHLTNEDFDIWTVLPGTKRYYNNAFRTAVNYEDLMAPKKVLKK